MSRVAWIIIAVSFAGCAPDALDPRRSGDAAGTDASARDAGALDAAPTLDDAASVDVGTAEDAAVDDAFVPVDAAVVLPAVERTLHFHEGTFTNRRTWVVPCPPGHPRFMAIRNYAFTASGAEHEPTDCDGLYRAGSGERGTATYVFSAVIPATYGVYVSFRTSANRNPMGALFIVNGEEQRIDQVDASGAYREVLFGDRALSGDVTVVLDSSREAESDAITEIRLVPR